MVIFPVLISSLSNTVEVWCVILFKIFINFSTSWSPHLNGLLRWHVMSIPVIREPIVQDSINLLSIPCISHSCCQWFKWSSTEAANNSHEFLMDIFEARGFHGKFSSPSGNVWVVFVVNIENNKIKSLSTKLKICNCWLITNKIILSLKLWNELF